jgi:hypothetical protein
MEKGLLVHRLNGTRDIAVVILQGVGRLPPRTEQPFKLRGEEITKLGRPRSPLIRDPFAMMSKIRGIELELTTRPQPNDFPHRVHCDRTPVRGKTHHLVLVAVARESKVLSHGLVKYAEGVREINPPFNVDLASFPAAEESP